MSSETVDSEPLRLVDELAGYMEIDTSRARRMIVQGDVKVGGAVVDDPAAHVRAGDKVEIIIPGRTGVLCNSWTVA